MSIKFKKMKLYKTEDLSIMMSVLMKTMRSTYLTCTKNIVMGLLPLRIIVFQLKKVRFLDYWVLMVLVSQPPLILSQQPSLKLQGQ